MGDLLAYQELMPHQRDTGSWIPSRISIKW